MLHARCTRHMVTRLSHAPATVTRRNLAVSSIRASPPQKSYFQAVSSPQPGVLPLRNNTVQQQPQALPEQQPQVIVIKDSQGGQSDAKKSIWLPRLGLIGLGFLLTIFGMSVWASLADGDDDEDYLFDDGEGVSSGGGKPLTTAGLMQAAVVLQHEHIDLLKERETLTRYNATQDDMLLKSHLFMLEGLEDRKGAVLDDAIATTHPIEFQDGTTLPASSVAVVKVLDSEGMLRSVLAGTDLRSRPADTLNDDLSDITDWLYDVAAKRLEPEGGISKDGFYVALYTTQGWFSVTSRAGHMSMYFHRYEPEDLPRGFPLMQLRQVKSA